MTTTDLWAASFVAAQGVRLISHTPGRYGSFVFDNTGERARVALDK